MPSRQAQRFDFMGPWGGIDNESAPEAVRPGDLISMSNMESRSGRLRPRRGSYRLTTATMPSAATSNPIRSMFSMYDPTTHFDSDLVCQGIYDAGGGLTYVGFWRYRVGTNDWSSMFGGAFNMNNTHHRATYAQVGDWLLIALGTQANAVNGAGELWAYRRSQISAARGDDVFRRAGLRLWTAGNGPTFTATSAVGGGSLSPGKTYTYKVTYYDSNTGIESDLSAASTSVTIAEAHNQVDFSVNDTTWPTRYYSTAPNPEGAKTDIVATEIRFYRIDAGLNNYHFVQSVPWDDTKTGSQTFSDTTADRSTNAVHLGRRGLPPAAIAYIAYFQDRLWAIPMDSNTLYWSEPTEQDTGRAGAEYFHADSYLMFPEGHRLTGIQSFGNELIVFQQDAVWSVDATPIGVGTALSPTIRKITGLAGCGSHHTIAQAGQVTGERAIYYANHAGVYSYVGVDAGKISTPISATVPTILGSPDRDFAGGGSLYYASAVYDFWHDRYLLACTLDSAANNFLTLLVFDVTSGSWFQWLMPNAASFQVHSMAVWRDDDSKRALIVLGLLGKVMILSSPEVNYFDDNGTDITYSGQTGFLHFGRPTTKKRIIEVESHWMAASGAAGATVQLDVYLDRSGTASKTETFTLAAGVNRVSTHVGAWGYECSLKWSGTTPDAAADMIGYSVLWEPRGFRG